MRTQFAIGDIIGSSFTVLFRNFLPFMALSLVFSLPNLVLLMNPASPTEGFSLRRGLDVAVPALCSLFLSGALVHSIYGSLLKRPIGMGECISKGISMILPILACILLTWICIAIGLLLFIIPGIIIALMLYVTIPCAVIEGTSAFESMKRSRYLTTGRRFQILALIIVVAIVSALIAAPIAMIVGSPYEVSLDQDLNVTITSNFPVLLVHYVLGAFGSALGACVSVVTYKCLKIEKEGTDLESIAAVFD